jgi:hypothetical protein
LNGVLASACLHAIPAKALPQLIPKRVIRACAFRARGVVIRHETIRTTEIIVAGHD